MEKRARSLRAEAVVLRHTDYGEADRLLTLYTPQLGKARALAKGVRKLTSRKAGHLEPFTYVKLQLAQGRDLWIITQADTLRPYLSLHEDLILTGHAAYVIELLDRLTYEDDLGNPSLFRLLTDTLDRLASGGDAWLAIRYFEMRLLDGLGYRPRLFECANCGREILAEDQFFSYTAGGVICPRCGQGLPNILSISVDGLKYLRHFQRSDYAGASRARPEPEVRRELETLMQGYFTYLLERQLNTPEFLKRIRQG